MTNYSSNSSTVLTVRIANEDLPLSRLLAHHKQQPLRTLMRQVWRDYLHAELAKLNLTLPPTSDCPAPVNQEW